MGPLRGESRNVRKCHEDHVDPCLLALVLIAAARNAVSTPFSRYSALANSPLFLSLSPLFLSFLSGSHDLYASKRGREREICPEESDVLRNVATPKRCSEGPCCSGGGQASFTPPYLRPSRSPFFHEYATHGDAVRTGGRRRRRPSPITTRGVTMITEAPALSERGDVAPSCRGTRLDSALEAQSTMMGEGERAENKSERALEPFLSEQREPNACDEDSSKRRTCG